MLFSQDPSKRLCQGEERVSLPILQFDPVIHSGTYLDETEFPCNLQSWKIQTQTSFLLKLSLLDISIILRTCVASLVNAAL